MGVKGRREEEGKLQLILIFILPQRSVNIINTIHTQQAESEMKQAKNMHIQCYAIIYYFTHNLATELPQLRCT